MAAKVRWSQSTDEILGTPFISTLRKSESAPCLYEDLADLGHGNGGRVVRARHRESGELVAKKTAEGSIERLVREAQVLTQCKHPNILSMQGLCSDGFSCSLVLELMDRGSLFDLIRVRSPMPDDALAYAVHQILLGLAYLHHEVHILHRDLKPSNILVNSLGEVKLADFGESTRGGGTSCSTVGSALYMSPERVQGQPYAEAADIWSLGCTIIELATAKPAFDGEALSVIELWEAIVMDPSPRLANSKLSGMVDACLAKDPAQRPSAIYLLSKSEPESKQAFLNWILP